MAVPTGVKLPLVPWGLKRYLNPLADAAVPQLLSRLCLTGMVMRQVLLTPSFELLFIIGWNLGRSADVLAQVPVYQWFPTPVFLTVSNPHRLENRAQTFGLGPPTDRLPAVIRL